MTDSLLLIAIGPVQDFIAAARRCQDLWFGSWLLSDLARVTAETVRAACGERSLIFPASFDVGTSAGQRPAVANKILAIVPSSADSRAVACDARIRMQDRLSEVAAISFRRIRDRTFFDANLQEIARRQVNDLMEFHWAAVPLDGGGRDAAAYATARAQVERVLGARKNGRSFRQIALATEGGWGAEVPKSSMDGQRESVLHEALYDALRNRPRRGFPPITAQQAAERYFVGPAERLCGVGLLKRAGAEDALGEGEVAGARLSRPLFHSTSHVAAGPLRTRIVARGRGAAVDAYARALFAACEGNARARERLTLGRVGAGEAVAIVRGPFQGEGWISTAVETPVAVGAERLDGAALFGSQLPAILRELRPGFAELGRREQEAVLEGPRKELSTLLRDLGVTEDEVPAYYATLIADGDAMGKALDRVGKTRGVDGHQKVSAALDDFARGCRGIVEAHAGSLVYAGGDDVLALLPLHTVLGCARRLHDAFAIAIRRALVELGDEGPFPTLSMGIGIGHHLDDMADARKLAREAEKSAKAHPGKDAIAVRAQMRSGGLLEVVGGFEAGGGLAVDRRIEWWAELLLREAIPDKAAFDLEKAMAPLLEGGAPRELSSAARSLAVGVLARKRGERGAERLPQELRSLVESHPLDGDVAGAVRGLSHEIQIARLVGGAIRLAFEAPAPAEEA